MFTQHELTEHMFSKLKLSEHMLSEIKLGEISFAETGHCYSIYQAWIHSIYIQSLENAYSLTKTDINRPANGQPLATQQPLSTQQSEKLQEQILQQQQQQQQTTTNE
jgi:hypothetical protein